MDSFAWLTQDVSSKLLLNKSYIPLIGIKATILLQYLCNTLEQPDGFIFREGRPWFKQNLKNVRYHTGLSDYELRTAKDQLLKDGFIEIWQDGSDRTTYWTVDSDKLHRFWMFAATVRTLYGPFKEQYLSRIRKWAAQNKEIVNEFKIYCEDFYDLLGEGWEAECQKEEKDNAPILLKEQPKEEEKPKVKEVARCPYVEYWNTLPHVPKCRYGTKSYVVAKNFFAAHRKFKAGETTGFVLTKDERQKINLAKLNEVPKDAKRIGSKQVPVRSDEEMFEHIRTAALAYDPKHAPFSKKHLGNLRSFLYQDGRFNKTGTVSYFLRYVSEPPRVIEDESYQALVNNATEDEMYVIRIVCNLYNISNNKEENTFIVYRDFKVAMGIARRIIKEYDKIRENTPYIPTIGSIEEFMDYWKSVCVEIIWDDMPLSAFDISKNLWRRFINSCNERLVDFNYVTQ